MCNERFKLLQCYLLHGVRVKVIEGNVAQMLKSLSGEYAPPNKDVEYLLIRDNMGLLRDVDLSYTSVIPRSINFVGHNLMRWSSTTGSSSLIDRYV
ncbi:hypothetical protein PanWU01x14_025300 [Parasponia andersonii]|uniref:Uncharacterized protein n=1 Tax=Parasponia andersonii TaxID=3476 RepID=A0A2P5DWV2_PARAD|nr:hypothetical protein PanWU01x14_025300 [Parasponia andersonii]